MSESSAGPSSSTLVSPPECLVHDHLSAQELIAVRRSPKRSFVRLFRSKTAQDRRRHSTDSDDNQSNNSGPSVSEDSDTLEIPFIKLGDGLVYSAEYEEDHDRDVYRWTVLYENQRGVTMFSTSYYSPLSLLPNDPRPFTTPSTSKSTRHSQPTVSLSSYPLPDGTWRWVSRSWMVDMRGDGQTQYDGFEYNWYFRGKDWRPRVGHLNAGGWVRRRRWVRLMVRPASGEKPVKDGISRPPSTMPTLDSLSESESTIDLWTGALQHDWDRCHAALKRLGRDGRKLELWRQWLGPPNVPIVPKKGGRGRRWTEDEYAPTGACEHPQCPINVSQDKLGEDAGITVSRAPREHIAEMIRNHWTTILASFTYPESRTRFIELLSSVGLLSEMRLEDGPFGSGPVLDFWSSSQSLQNLVEHPA